jgi:hypothetical protein
MIDNTSIQLLIEKALTSHAILGALWGLMVLVFGFFSAILHYHWRSYGPNIVIRRALIIYYIGGIMFLVLSGVLIFFI